MKRPFIVGAILAAAISGYYGSRLARGQENTASVTGAATIDIRDVQVQVQRGSKSVTLFTYPSADIGFVMVHGIAPLARATPVIVYPDVTAAATFPAAHYDNYRFDLKSGKLTASWSTPAGSAQVAAYHLVAIYK